MEIGISRHIVMGNDPPVGTVRHHRRVIITGTETQHPAIGAGTAEFADNDLVGRGIGFLDRHHRAIGIDGSGQPRRHLAVEGTDQIH